MGKATSTNAYHVRSIHTCCLAKPHVPSSWLLGIGRYHRLYTAPLTQTYDLLPRVTHWKYDDVKWEPGNQKAHMKFSFHPSGVDNYYCPVMHRVESGLNFESLCLANPVVLAQELSFHTGNPEKERTLKDGRTGLSCKSVVAGISRRWCLLATSLSSHMGIPVCIFSGKGCKTTSSKDRQATVGRGGILKLMYAHGSQATDVAPTSL